MNAINKLDAPLLRIARDDFVSARDLTSSVLVFGVTGSGKTSGAGAAFRRALLRSGDNDGAPTGGIVLCAKPDEVDGWTKDARANGRENSLIVFGPDGKHGYNFIDAALAKDGIDACPKVADFIMCAVEATRNPNSSSSSESFFDDAKRQLLGKALPPLFSANGTVRMEELARYIQTAPTSIEELGNPEWQEKSYWFRTMALARKSPIVPIAAEEFNLSGRYFKDEWCRLDPKTRTNIAISLSVVLDRFASGPLKRAFCEKATFTLEMTWHGAIVIVAFPTLTMNEDGAIANKLMKLAWQRCMLGRNSQAEHHRRALSFCYADECQQFLLPTDADFLAVSRQSNACNFFLTQSLPGIVNSIGGPRAREAALMLCGNFQTKIFHTLDSETSIFAADTIGKGMQWRSTHSENFSTGVNFGSSMGENEGTGTSSGFGISIDHQGNRSTSVNTGESSNRGTNHGVTRGRNEGESRGSSLAEQIDYDLQPSYFSRHLKTGGPANGNEVTAIWYQSGRTFNATGTNYLHVTFKQEN